MGTHPILKNLLSILFPPLCLCCKKRLENEGALCRRCREKVEVFNAFYCPRCFRRLLKATRCPVCRTTKDLKNRFILAAASSYQNEVVRKLIHALKYQRIKTALEPLADILKRYLEKTSENWKSVIGNFIIIPMPLHIKKEKERGFNQAWLLAQVIQKLFGPTRLPIEKNNLIKIKATKPQAELKDYKERAKNVAGCFKLKRPEEIKNKNIILVDDVFTSGATMTEAIKVLKKAGAKKIIGFTVTKT